MIKAEGNRNRKCKCCEKKLRSHDGYIVGVNFVCSRECASGLAIKALEKQRERQKVKSKQLQAIKTKEANKRHSERKNEVKPIKYWQDKLQNLVNQYVTDVRDKDKPCCTCGTTNPDIKYDAGHYRTRAAAPFLRYELKNIHKQCSVQCNQYGSGMRAEYREFIKSVHGEDVLEWLDSDNHPSLKEMFQHWTDYDKEIKRYRKLLRDNGVKPRV